MYTGPKWLIREVLTEVRVRGLNRVKSDLQNGDLLGVILGAGNGCQKPRGGQI
jgi:hypothetical protein